MTVRNFCHVARRLTARQQKFAEELASGASGAEAARRAGYSPRRANRTAFELVSNRDVAARIAELQAAALAELPITVERHAQRLAELRDDAAALGQYSAAVRAEELRGKLAGLYRERVDLTQNVADRVMQLPAEDQRQVLRAALRRLHELAPEVMANLGADPVAGRAALPAPRRPQRRNREGLGKLLTRTASDIPIF